MSTEDRIFNKAEETRLHALNLAASTYREVFRITKEGEEQPDLAEQIVADAAKYEAFIKGAVVEQ